VEPNWYLANPEFDREIMEFAEFMEKKLRLKHPTLEADVQHVFRLLGWMCRKKKEALSLSEVRLAKVVPFIQMKFKLTECTNEQNREPHMVRMYREGMAIETSEELGKEAGDLIEGYVEWGNLSHASVVQNYNAIINLAKFTYHRQVSSEDLKSRDAFDKIPLINVLKARRRIHERETRTQAKTTTEKLSLVVPYPQIIEVLEKARFEATLEVKHYQRSNRYRRGRPKIDKVPRMDTGIARSFQRFIIIALMLSCPPRRPKEYYEAEIGKTLLKGGFQDGLFVTVEKMKNPNEAQYYLWPEDYKTMKTYGEVGIPLTNFTFPDGTRFYHYLEMWINKWRKVLVKEQTHNFLFLQDKNGKLLSSSTFGKKVKHIFWRFAEIAMSPHKLRHSFETYSQEIGLSEAEKQASVLAMGHSLETKRKHYDLREKIKIMQPALDFNQRIVEKELRSFDRSKLVEGMIDLDEEDDEEE
jgi:glycosyltransferase involved in cell wall biosynthesis